MLFSLFLFFSQAWAGESVDIEVIVKGMVCSFCVQGIEKKFGKEDAVEKVSVALEESKVSIWLKEDKSLSDERLTELIQESGYNVDKIKRPLAPQK